MKQSKFITTSEMAEELGISKSYAYKLVRQLNEELESRGFFTLSGKVSRTFFEEKFFGVGGEFQCQPIKISKKGRGIFNFTTKIGKVSKSRS